MTALQAFAVIGACTTLYHVVAAILAAVREVRARMACPMSGRALRVISTTPVGSLVEALQGRGAPLTTLPRRELQGRAATSTIPPLRRELQSADYFYSSKHERAVAQHGYQIAAQIAAYSNLGAYESVGIFSTRAEGEEFLQREILAAWNSRSTKAVHTHKEGQ